MFHSVKKIIIRFGLPVFMLSLCAVYAMTFYTRGKAEESPPIASYGQASERIASSPSGLKLMTLNIAHGRKDGFSQIFQDAGTIRSHLDDIVAMLKREAPDLLALQEADGPSVWSGDFDHVAYIAENAGFSYSVRGEHVRGMGLSYGTSLLSGIPLENAISVTFAPSPPTFSKGFVSAVFRWPGEPDSEIRVLSVHLDFSRKSVREQQVRKIRDRFFSEQIPLIVMGDFNCEWEKGGSVLAMMTESMTLKVYQQEAADMPTFPLSGKRLDWIALSPLLEFAEYGVLPDILSDHRAVFSRITKTESPVRGSYIFLNPDMRKTGASMSGKYFNPPHEAF